LGSSPEWQLEWIEIFLELHGVDGIDELVRGKSGDSKCQG
jgi:hypothetical protein